jgi:hypothetical protein
MAVTERDLPANEVSTPGRGKVLPFFKSMIDAILEPSRRARYVQDRRGFIWRRTAHLAHLGKIASKEDPIRLEVIGWTTREIQRYMAELKTLGK